nr:MAG: hypothetical protein [Bacteriophage sp.]
MAVCVISKGLEKSTACGYSLPQIVNIYLANFADVTATEIGAPEEGEGVEVKTITLASTKQFYKVEPNKNSASWSDALAVGGNNNKYRVHTVGFSFSLPTNPDMVDIVDGLSLGRFIAVLQLADGSYVMLGRQTGLEADADGVNQTGSGDATAESGLAVSLTGNVTESAVPLSAEAITTVTKPTPGA